jgi:D-alanyl-D-alanine carboxypeptidase (penicillin-binding protein 5/6)
VVVSAAGGTGGVLSRGALFVISSTIAIVIGVLLWAVGVPNVELPHGHGPVSGVSVPWPGQGQAALEVSGGPAFGSAGGSQPVPIASLAKVMTAYVVLDRFPLSGDQAGFTIEITASEVQDTAARRARGESVVAMWAGERVTEREALEALLLPSANNMASVLAARVGPTSAVFVDAMNVRAQQLGMAHTTYTDPSGFDSTTVSTAADQLLLATAAMRDATFASLVRLPSAVLPAAGTVLNTDTLLGQDGFVGIKTGSDQAAGGCFMFESVQFVDGNSVVFVGVVLGQRDGPLIAAGLTAGRKLVDDTVPQLIAAELAG